MFEQLFRAGTTIESPLWELADPASVDDILGLASEAAVADLCALIEAAWEPLIAVFAQVPAADRHLGPVFAGSLDVGGADADYILGSCSVGVKSTIRPETLAKDLVYQLIGYPLLDYDDRFHLDEVAFYMARQATIVRWPLAHILRTLAPVNASSPLARKPDVDVAAVRAELRDVLAPQREEIQRRIASRRDTARAVFPGSPRTRTRAGGVNSGAQSWAIRERRSDAGERPMKVVGHPEHSSDMNTAPQDG